MMLPTDARGWTRVGVFAAPTLAAIGFAIFRAGPGPSEASAGSAVAAADQMPELSPLALDPQQRAALTFGETPPSSGNFATPMLQLDRDVETIEHAVVEVPEDDEIEPPAFELRSVLRGRHPIAVIDGTPRRIGDDLGDGWSLKSIDIQTRTVTVAHASGVSAQVAIGTD